MEGTLRFLRSVSGVLRTHGAATLVHLLRARRMGNNDAHRVTGMDSLGIYGRQPIGRWSIPTQCSTFMFHVKPGVDRTHWPIQRVSATFTGHASFSHSPSRRMRLNDPGRTQETSGSGEPDTNRISSSAWGNTNGKVDAQTSARYTLPLTKDR